MNNKFYFYISPNLNNEFHKWIINYLVEIIGLIPIQQNKLTKKTHLVYGEYDSANNSEKINIPHNPTDLLNEAILKGENKKDLLKNPNFEFIRHDVVNPITIEVDKMDGEQLSDLQLLAGAVILLGVYLVNKAK